MKNPIIYSFILIILSFANIACTQVSKNEILISRDLEYKQAPDYLGKMQLLKLDIYQQPKLNKTKRPIVILVHGGGFAAGDKGTTAAQGSFYPDLANTFADHGYVAFSINYRLWPDCPIDSFHIELGNAISDVVKAVKWIKGKSNEYDLDTTKIIICGDSAGGGLVVNSAYSNTPLFAGVIDMWGGLPPYGIQKNGSNSVNVFPVSRLTPPTCFIHGSVDDVVPYSVSQRLSDSLTVAKVYNELHPLTGAKHYPNNLANQIFPIMIAFADKIVFGKSNKNQ